MATASPNRPSFSNADPCSDKHSALVMRNVSIRGHRTSIALEPQIWDTLFEMCRRESCTPHDICSYVSEHKPPHASLTSALRVFILDYFRTSATEDGHIRTGHGQGMFLPQQQERLQLRKLRADALGRKTPDGSYCSPQRGGSGPRPASEEGRGGDGFEWRAEYGGRDED